MTKLHNFLYKRVDSSIVCFFRIIFGCFMAYQMIYYYEVDYTFQFMAGPEVLFPYYGFSFLKPLSLGVLKWIHFGLFVSTILIALGYLYRYAMIFFFTGFTYFSFIDKTLYNNHIYLIALLAFVLIFINADKKYSLRSRFSKNKIESTIPAWSHYILIFLISLPYFFGGIAKLSPNWIDSNLISIIVEQSSGSFLYSILPQGLLIMLITYGGILFDLSIVFILLNKRTRKIGFLLVVIFSYVNGSVLFNDIGIFPFFMICSTILFFDSIKVGEFLDVFFTKKPTLKKFKNKEERKKHLIKQKHSNLNDSIDYVQKNDNRILKNITTCCLVFFVVFHLLFPFRHFFMTNNPEWTSIASKFSWRMKMQTRKVTEFKMSLTDKATSNTYNLDGKSYVSSNQFLHIIEDPYAFVQLSKYISRKLKKERGLKNSIINLNLKVEFNGFPSQNIISPDIDLTQIDESPFVDHSWIPELKKN